MVAAQGKPLKTRVLCKVRIQPRLTNPLKKKTVYAKVIARIPDQAYGDDIVVVLSPSVAKLLGAKDPKFFVELKYFEYVKE